LWGFLFLKNTGNQPQKFVARPLVLFCWDFVAHDLVTNWIVAHMSELMGQKFIEGCHKLCRKFV